MDIVEALRQWVKDDWASERPKTETLCNNAADEIERLRAELAAFNQPVPKSEWQELVAERDALRELLREARAYVVSDHGWDYENGGWLADRIDAALAEKEKP